VHQVGDHTRLCYDARPTSRQVFHDLIQTVC